MSNISPGISPDGVYRPTTLEDVSSRRKISFGFESEPSKLQKTSHSKLENFSKYFAEKFEAIKEEEGELY